MTLTFEPPYIAHRGASSLAPENTMAAFLKAKDVGASWVEFDVMLAECGEAVVIHDETLERTTNGKGNVCDFPYSYLQTLDAGRWFDPKFSGEKIPMFVQVINLLKSLQLSANVEIKAVPGQEERVVTKVLREIQQHWTSDMTPPLISSFSIPILRHVRKLAPAANIGVLIDEIFDGWQNVCLELNCFSVNVNQQLINPVLLHALVNMHKKVLTYTVNDPIRAKELFGMGVSAVFTDRFVEMVESFRGKV
jgi:glycerophosphoryl diester phosphodiesterase